MDTKRGDDAQDHTPRPMKRDDSPVGVKQDAENYEERGDQGAIEIEDMSSANDEGAN